MLVDLFARILALIRAIAEDPDSYGKTAQSRRKPDGLIIPFLHDLIRAPSKSIKTQPGIRPEVIFFPSIS